MKCLGGLGWAEEWGFDGSGQAYELGEGVVAEVGDPEVAAGVYGDGKGFEHVGVWRPACDGRERLAGIGGGGTGQFGKRWAAIVGDPDIA